MVSHENPESVIEDCTVFMLALKNLAEKELPVIHKNVVVFQPHIRSTLWEKTENKFKESSNPSIDNSLRKALMLSTILIETKIACLKQQANFQIWGECDNKVEER